MGINVKTSQIPRHITCPECGERFYVWPSKLTDAINQINIAEAKYALRYQEAKAKQKENGYKGGLQQLIDKQRMLAQKKNVLKKNLSALQSAAELELFSRFRDHVSEILGHDKMVEIMIECEDELTKSDVASFTNRLEEAIGRINHRILEEKTNERTYK